MPRPITLPEPWASLADKLGGVQALSDIMKSDVRTIRRWANLERRPSALAQAAIEALFREHGLPFPEFKR